MSTLTTLAAHLETECPYDWRITVADNGSTDETFELATAFAAADTRTRVIRLEERGRGRALKQAWSTSTSDIVAYMDVDLSTGLESLRPLLDPVVDGRCEVSVGSRLAPGAEIARTLQREVISRGYNVLARAFLHYGIVDAQCGFKAIRASLARDLIPEIEDNGWFFDTELLALAYRSGARINEVPVRWIEDHDSRVKIVKTATDDLKGIWRLWRDGRRNGTGGVHRAPVGTSPSTPATRGGVDFDTLATTYEDTVDRSVSFTGRDARSTHAARWSSSRKSSVHGWARCRASPSSTSAAERGRLIATSSRGWEAPRRGRLRGDARAGQAHGAHGGIQLVRRRETPVPRRIVRCRGRHLRAAPRPRLEAVQRGERDGARDPSRRVRGGLRAQPVQPAHPSCRELVCPRSGRRAPSLHAGSRACSGTPPTWSPVCATISSPRWEAPSAARSTATSSASAWAANTSPGWRGTPPAQTKP